MTFVQPVRVFRIVAPVHRQREGATVHDLAPGDIVEMTEPPVFRVDPYTREATAELKRFVVGKSLGLRPTR